VQPQIECGRQRLVDHRIESSAQHIALATVIQDAGGSNPPLGEPVFDDVRTFGREALVDIRPKVDRTLYKQRNGIERMFGRLKINRAIATRYDQLAESFMSMAHIATARYWLKFVHAA
jgi:hypothetical protein